MTYWRWRVDTCIITTKKKQPELSQNQRKGTPMWKSSMSRRAFCVRWSKRPSWDVLWWLGDSNHSISRKYPYLTSYLFFYFTEELTGGGLWWGGRLLSVSLCEDIFYSGAKLVGTIINQIHFKYILHTIYPDDESNNTNMDCQLRVH